MTNNKSLTPVQKLKQVTEAPSVQEQFKNAMRDKKDLFVASLIDLYASDSYMQQCNPQQVVMEALKAATLNLPINKSLGFAYIVPYKSKGNLVPQFQLGYKGMIQLAIRTGQYRHINADLVYEGEFQGFDRITGELDISGEKQSDKVTGFFAYIETVNGFTKTMYMSREDMEKHAKKYSKSYSRDYSPWKTEFEEMGKKTMIRALLGKYGIMTIEMADGINKEEAPSLHQGNDQDIIDINPPVDTTTGEILPDDEQPPPPEKAPFA